MYCALKFNNISSIFSINRSNNGDLAAVSAGPVMEIDAPSSVALVPHKLLYKIP